MDRWLPRRPLWIVASGFAALIVLLPPWQEANGTSVGYGPLLAPPQYTTMTRGFISEIKPTYEPDSWERDPTTGLLRVKRGQMIDPGQPEEWPTFETHTATVAWGRLVTQLAALAVITAVAAGLLRSQDS